MPHRRILCFGELLIRLQSTSETFFEKDENMLKMYPGGSEANVAVALAQLHVPSRYVSAIPQNALTAEIESLMKGYGVDTSYIIHQGERLGSYFLLSANGLSKGDVIYDREYSSFSQLTTGTIDWESVFEGISWFHFTALSPSLNAHLADVCLEALAIAEKKGIIISVDLNYRNRLWQYGKRPDEVMPTLVRYADVIMGNIWAANKMLGTSIDEGFNISTDKETYINYAKDVSQAIFRLFPKCKHIANTFRFMKNAKHNLFYATYHTTADHFVSTVYETQDVVDRIGSGDAFMGGLIAAISQGMEGQDVIELATKTGFEKLFVKGDFLRF